ncbi:hypothetical protein G6F70_003730 [Rhizopus microsporus]|uniref:MT-A70-domain-containing protein n=2 Tax=Rhizopus TaxID=4842 RepID=A0A1X0RMQ8_RHIZD|nr:hypothetical protein G6F71_007283 [Rhizopus microsporus]KAG1200808.1 hypothetical protein G6F70_003730 [Rhizopus microsporus]KAG1215192.1 hypothetical protein G6F69_001256 [Rhizopus microsporus]KAG1229820.1 hypothetical protein G6F67_006887 [Rhizopus microsporus]ORE13287.1 hypothetical protein BCV71DRAFT_258690 [Rhizopus microsporus]
MSDRPKRKRRQTPKTKVSAAHYVGYVEDGESVEAIMKKFEELERIEKEFSAMKVDNPSEDEQKNLTEEQLEEIFKRTSAFTVKSTTIDRDTIEDLDALDLWEIEYKDGDTNEFYEEDEYHYVDESFWDEEFGEKPARKGKQIRSLREQKPLVAKGRGVDRESIIAKYKIMQVQVQDRNGNYFTIKKRVSNVDPSLPTYVKIPPRPIPMSWAHSIKSISKCPKEIVGSRYYEVDSIVSTDLTQYGTDFNAVYMDPPFLLPGEEPVAGKITIDDFSALNVADIVKTGFLFIWLEKEWIQKVVTITAKWGFKYVENFCWIKKDVNNQIHKSPYRYFNKSKLSLLIFRKEGDIELRHQRNPDCVFDFIRPKLPDEISEKKPPFMYKVIETLLPTANYHIENNPNGERLLELWAKKGQRRQGWTAVVEKLKNTTACNTSC